MKKITLIFILFLSLGFYSCSKEKSCTCVIVQSFEDMPELGTTSEQKTTIEDGECSDLNVTTTGMINQSMTCTED